MLVTNEALLLLLLGKKSEVVAEWTEKGDLIIGVYPQGDTYEEVKLALERGMVCQH